MFIKQSVSKLLFRSPLNVYSIMSRHKGHGARGMWRARPLRVLVDMDGVLCDFEGHFLKVFREKHPDLPFIPLENRNTFYLADQYSLLDPDQTINVRAIVDSEGFFRNIPVIEGAIDAIKEISSLDGIEVFLCTSPMTRTCYSASEKMEWIKLHLGPAWMKQAVIAHDKTMVQGDILIDDRPSIKGSIRKPSWDHILFTAWHNRHIDLKDSTATVKLSGWDNKQEWMDLLHQYKSKIA